MTTAYQVKTLLGSGGFGKTYRAADPSGQAVVVKVPSPSTLEGIHRAHLEALLEALEPVQHPGVARWIEVVDLDSRYAVIGEYVDGVDLATLALGGSVPPRPVLQICGRVADALTELGHHGQVHGDLRPENLLLTQRGMVKMVDTGLSIIDRREIDADLTAFYGRQQYMAPERIVGNAVPASDVFSLGRVLFELLTGSRPAQSSSNPGRASTCQQLLMGQLRAVLDDNDEGIVELFEHSQAFEPSARPDAASFATRCKALVAKVEGQSLGSWTRKTLPEIAAAREEFPLVDGTYTLIGRVLGDVPAKPEPAALAPATSGSGIPENVLIGVGIASFATSAVIALLALVWIFG